jgi:hypothetical protein
MALLVLLVLLGLPAVAPPDEAPDFKVAFWYQRRDPLNTFRYQIYDVRKGEYNPVAVAAWLDRMAHDFPGYKAYVNDVRVAPGEEPRKKVASVINAEQIRTGGPNGGPGLRGDTGAFNRGLNFGNFGARPSPRPSRTLPSVGGSPTRAGPTQINTSPTMPFIGGSRRIPRQGP